MKLELCLKDLLSVGQFFITEHFFPFAFVLGWLYNLFKQDTFEGGRKEPYSY